MPPWRPGVRRGPQSLSLEGLVPQGRPPAPFERRRRRGCRRPEGRRLPARVQTPDVFERHRATAQRCRSKALCLKDGRQRLSSALSLEAVTRCNRLKPTSSSMMSCPFAQVIAHDPASTRRAGSPSPAQGRGPWGCGPPTPRETPGEYSRGDQVAAWPVRQHRKDHLNLERPR